MKSNFRRLSVILSIIIIYIRNKIVNNILFLCLDKHIHNIDLMIWLFDSIFHGQCMQQHAGGIQSDEIKYHNPTYMPDLLLVSPSVTSCYMGSIKSLGIFVSFDKIDLIDWLFDPISHSQSMDHHARGDSIWQNQRS